MDWMTWTGIGAAELVFLVLFMKRCRISLFPAAAVSLSAGVCSIAGVALLQLFFHVPVRLSWFWGPLFIFLFAGLIILTRFFRDPERKSPSMENGMVSPADGAVCYVKEIQAGAVPVSEKKGRTFRLRELVQTDLLEDGAVLVGIEMNILNVHVNRAPVSGKILLQKPIHGTFKSLRDPDAPAENERVTTVLDHGSFRIGVVQIASRLVRRIVSFRKEGESIRIGDRIGMIRFGSQVDVILPRLPDLTIRVRTGEHVRAGETVIAEFRAEPL